MLSGLFLKNLAPAALLSVFFIFMFWLVHRSLLRAINYDIDPENELRVLHALSREAIRAKVKYILYMAFSISVFVGFALFVNGFYVYAFLVRV